LDFHPAGAGSGNSHNPAAFVAELYAAAAKLDLKIRVDVQARFDIVKAPPLGAVFDRYRIPSPGNAAAVDRPAA
jgi:hypothetical protein